MQPSHDDLQRVIQNEAYAVQSDDQLRALLKVPIKPTGNTTYTQLMHDGLRLIREELEARAGSRKKKAPDWPRIGVWIALGALIATVLIFYLVL